MDAEPVLELALDDPGVDEAGQAPGEGWFLRPGGQPDRQSAGGDVVYRAAARVGVRDSLADEPFVQGQVREQLVGGHPLSLRRRQSGAVVGPPHGHGGGPRISALRDGAREPAGGPRRSGRPAPWLPRAGPRGHRSPWLSRPGRGLRGRRRPGRWRSRSGVNPRQDNVPDPVRADALGRHPGQVPADPAPQVVIAAVGDRPPAGVPQQLPVRRGMPLLAVLDEAGHQGGRDRLPADRLALLPQ